MAERERVPIRGYLLHLTHYDPWWFKRKGRERAPDMKLAAELVGAMAEADMNLLVVDCADGVRYKSHPELKRRYSVPMSALKKLAARARKRGIEVVPKLNFAQSHFHRHNEWFRPHHWLFDSEEYWRIAFELIDELIGACAPERFFHIGMDEDHGRSHAQYAQAILTLHEGLAERGLRTVMWKDDQTYPGADVHREKSRAAERKIPKDVVQVVWHYKTVLKQTVRRLTRKGFEVWGDPGAEPEQVAAWRDCILRYGGTGLLLTQWVPCRPGNRRRLLRVVRELGPVCGDEEGTAG
jgi:hypothetical protein